MPLMMSPVPNTNPTTASAATLTNFFRGPMVGVHGGRSSDWTPLTSPPESSSTAYAPPDAASLPEVASAPSPMNAPTEAAANANHACRAANGGTVIAATAETGAMPRAPAVSNAVAAMNPTSMNTPVYAMERGLSRAFPQMPWPDVHPLPMADPAPTSPPLSRARPTPTMGSEARWRRGWTSRRRARPRREPGRSRGNGTRASGPRDDPSRRKGHDDWRATRVTRVGAARGAARCRKLEPRWPRVE
mmetsp:Transcript_9180/g.40411  ORF Transcript_9180/g.40411 Transcript_9180/m.40411 type:complete len:246 (+) Transcript_9180:474-1211(+)